VWNFLSYTLIGTVIGGGLAVSASGVVVTYSTTGVFNLAHGAVGMVAAFTMWELSYNPAHADLPVLVGIAIVLLVEAPLIGLLVEALFMRRLHGASTERVLMVTIGLLLVLLGVTQAVWGGQTSRVVTAFFPGTSVHVGPVGGGVSITGQQLLTLGVAAAVAAGLFALLRWLRIGMAMRAVVDDPELLAMAGARPVAVARAGWVLGCFLAALAGVLLASALTPLQPFQMSLLVVNGFAAAAFGRLRSLPLTFLGALLLGLLESYAVGYLPQWSFLQYAPEWLPMALLFVVLLVLPQDRLRAVGRPVVAVIPKVAGLRASLLGAAALVAASLAAGAVLSGTWLTTAEVGVVYGLVALSLVLLTGYAGQVSLAQLTFAGVGAYMMGRVAGGGSWLGVLAAVGVSAALGAVVAIPTLRLSGLYLALATLALAQVATFAFFVPEIDQKAPVTIHRLGLPGLPLDTDGRQEVLGAVAFALAGVLVLAVRRGTFGRRLVALSDSPVAYATVGLDVKLTRMGVFALSAGVAGLAGALRAQQVILNSSYFDLTTGLVLLLLLAIWGVRTVSGALLAGLSLAALDILSSHAGWAGQIPGLAVGAGIVLLGRAPNGVLGLRLDQAVARALRGRTPDGRERIAEAAARGGADAA